MRGWVFGFQVVIGWVGGWVDIGDVAGVRVWRGVVRVRRGVSWVVLIHAVRQRSEAEVGTFHSVVRMAMH